MKLSTLYTVMFAALVLMASALCGCTAESYSGRFTNIPTEGWSYYEPLVFSGICTDSIAEGALALNIRHTNEYLYSNIYVEVKVDDRRDTFNVVLADNYGRWYGRGIGTDFQLSDTIYPSLRLTADSEIAVRHIMRVDTLPEIEQIGISFIKK